MGASCVPQAEDTEANGTCLCGFVVRTGEPGRGTEGGLWVKLGLPGPYTALFTQCSGWRGTFCVCVAQRGMGVAWGVRWGLLLAEGPDQRAGPLLGEQGQEAEC